MSHMTTELSLVPSQPEHFLLGTNTCMLRKSQSLLKENKRYPTINLCYWKFHGSGEKFGGKNRWENRVITYSLLHAQPCDFASSFSLYVSTEWSPQERVLRSRSAPC